MAFNLRNIVTGKATLIFILIIEVLFPFYSTFASLTVKNCCHTYKVTKKHCCCEMAERQENTSSCELNLDMQSSHSLSKCDCIHKAIVSSNEVTPQKNFELSKEIAVTYFVDNLSNLTTSFSAQKVVSIEEYHSPPIYLVTSTLII